MGNIKNKHIAVSMEYVYNCLEEHRDFFGYHIRG